METGMLQRKLPLDRADERPLLIPYVEWALTLSRTLLHCDTWVTALEIGPRTEQVLRKVEEIHPPIHLWYQHKAPSPIMRVFVTIRRVNSGE